MERKAILRFHDKEIDVSYTLLDKFRKDVKITSVKTNGGMFDLLPLISSTDIFKLKKQIRKIVN
jgi:hypothetical protein